MEKQNKQETNPLANTDPRNRDFQRTDDDIDSVSDSEKIAAEGERNEANPKDRDFQRKDGDVDRVSESEEKYSDHDNPSDL